MQSAHSDSPHDALIKALEKVDDMHAVLIIYEGKEGFPTGSFDSDLKVANALYLIELFRAWLMNHVLGVGD